MKLTPRKLDILRLLRRVFYLRTAQIRDRLLPHDDDGSTTRSELRKLEQAGFARRYQPKMVDPLTGGAPPIFTITLAGAAALAQVTGDCAYLLRGEPDFRDWMSMNHHCLLSSLALQIDDASAGQDLVTLHNLCFEHEVMSDAADPAKKFRLYTRLDEHLKCCPDMLIDASAHGWRRAWYVEYETGADGSPARVIAKKHKGYSGLAAAKLYKQHAPDARDMRVIVFTPGASWCTALLQELRGKPGSHLWLVCASRDVTPEKFLHGEIFYKLEREGEGEAVRGPFPLIPRTLPATVPGEGQPAGRLERRVSHVQLFQA